MSRTHGRVGRGYDRHSMGHISTVQLESKVQIQSLGSSHSYTLGFQTECCIFGGPLSIFFSMTGWGHPLSTVLSSLCQRHSGNPAHHW